jgi:PAS domain S-box-containing protein
MPDAENNTYQRFFSLLESMLCTAGFDGVFRDLNRAWETSLGYSAAEMVGRPCVEFIHPEDRAAVIAHQKKIAAGQPSSIIEARFLCKDGKYKWLILRCTADTERQLFYAAASDITSRKLTEDALRESEATLRKILDKAPMSMSIVNIDGTIEYINKKAELTFGFRHDEIPTMERWWELAYPDPAYRAEVVPRWMGRVYKAFEEKTEIDGGLYEVTCKDGTVKTVFIFGVIAAGKVFVMFDDITERAKAEAALKESEVTLRRILDQAPISIAISAMDGRIEHINRKMTQTFGYEAADMPTLQRWAEQAYPDEKYRNKLLTHWATLIDKALRTDGEIEGGEYRVVCKDGKVKTVFIYGVVTADKKVVSLLEDVTSRVETEKGLRESESRYRALVETTRTGYVIINKEGRVLDANTEYVRLTGNKDLKEVLGRNVLDWTADYEKERNAAAVADCARDGYIWNFEVDYAGKAGQTTPIEINATVIQKDGVPQIMTLCRDISGRRRTEAEITELNHALENRVKERTAELTAANEELVTEISQRLQAERAKEKLQEQLTQSQKLEAVGRLAGGIAHDFNNILVSISGYAELLLDTMPQGAPARADLSEILLETERGSALTRQLLTFSTKQEIKLQVLDVNAIAAGSEKMLKRLIGANMHLETRLSPELFQVKADPGQISQIIINLVINARDAMPDGGKILMETRNAEVGADAPDMRLVPAPGSYAELSVSDTGLGMSPETLAHLFEPFYTTKKPGQGTGLGLSTIYGIVSHARGGISVASVQGRGTVMKIYLPRAV